MMNKDGSFILNDSWNTPYTNNLGERAARYCEKCKMEYNINVKYCEKCGAELKVIDRWG